MSEVALDRIGLNELLEALLARIAEVLDADSAAILLLGANGELGVRATFGLDGLRSSMRARSRSAPAWPGAWRRRVLPP